MTGGGTAFPRRYFMLYTLSGSGSRIHEKKGGVPHMGLYIMQQGDKSGSLIKQKRQKKYTISENFNLS